jgi:hypothetical protein
VSSPFASSLTSPAAARDHRSSRAWEGWGVLRRVAVRVGDVGVRERVAVERPAGDCRDAAATAALES